LQIKSSGDCKFKLVQSRSLQGGCLGFQSISSVVQSGIICLRTLSLASVSGHDHGVQILKLRLGQVDVQNLRRSDLACLKFFSWEGGCCGWFTAVFLLEKAFVLGWSEVLNCSVFLIEGGVSVVVDRVEVGLSFSLSEGVTIERVAEFEWLEFLLGNHSHDRVFWGQVGVPLSGHCL